MRRLTIRTAPVRRRVNAGVVCLLSALLLAVLPLPRGAEQAQAATTGSSAVTKSGTKGKYDDFSRLKVTVHQTKGLTWQGVKVSWTGGAPAPKSAQKVNFLQFMQCWGDDPAKGPDRTQCEFGQEKGTPPGSLRLASATTDPEESDSLPQDSAGAGSFVPFRPVSGATTAGAYDTTYFSSENTNSVSWIPNDGNGSGEMVFELRSAGESEYLGCGARRNANGEIEPCWLVVVPRGEYEPDGSSAANKATVTSALSQSNWDRRIVFRLDFQPIEQNCAADQSERPITGSELATDAVTSWQSQLCKTGDSRFTYATQGEPQARDAITTPGAGGLAMTVNPVEAAEGGVQVVHAPAAITGVTIGFVWMFEKSTFEYVPLKKLKLNQRLLAKVLTQSYASSLLPRIEGKPDYLSGNPGYIGGDPEFRKLNPDFVGDDYQSPIGLVVSDDNTDSASMLWNYILADPDARKFLEGQKDPWGMKVNPAYLADGVISDSLDYFPKADLTATAVPCKNGGPHAPKTLNRSGLDVVPYADSMHSAAVEIRQGDIGTAYECMANTATAGLTKLGRPSPVDQRQMGVVDNPSAVRYQLGTAALPNADGDYVQPTNDSLLKAVAEMPDSGVTGVRKADPAKMKDGAYPLAALVYAAAPLDQAKDARQDYARVIRYAAGQGQTQGAERGRLPYGYAPLTTALRRQAEQAADRLEKGVPDSGGSSSGGTAGGSDVGGTGNGAPGGGGVSGGGLAGGTGAGSAGAASDGGASGSGRPSPVPSETDPAKQNVAQSGGLTPSEVLGLIRWVLLGVLIAGGVAALAGPVMLRLSARRAAGGG
ncbi:hypothetical protein ACWD5R_02375 [Streptomyces sp. NPDC002514]|uniref:hypothetical protein n=1 Tax=Streptomyces sp. NPDC001270 TaxID=3364554 RepID=UPI00368973E2